MHLNPSSSIDRKFMTRMTTHSIIETPLKHRGSNRPAAVLRVDEFWRASPIAVAEGKYVLVVACEDTAGVSSIEVARTWIDAGASYLCAWGPRSEVVEETFDYAGFSPAYGEPLSFTLMTTSHKDEVLDDALWFAFYNAIPPYDIEHELSTVVVVVDSVELESKCVAWIRENVE